MESIWRKSCEISGRRKLSGNVKTQVLVIGAGMTGILTAWHLQKKGYQVIVVEANRIGSGQTERTTAKITSQHGMVYQKISGSLGEEAAKDYAKENEAAIRAYKEIIEKENISCHFEECPAWLYSTKEAECLKKEAELAQKLGICAAFTKETELPFTVEGAVKFEGQAHFHPLEFMKHLSEQLTVYEGTRIRKTEGNKAYLENGEIEAEHIVFATHYPFLNRPGYYFMKMHQERSYVLALKDAMPVKGMYYGVDKDGLSIRPYEDLLLLGGGNHRTGENKEGGKYDHLQAEALCLFPDSHEVARWSAQDCMTLDGVPYIGRFSKDTPNWYVGTGYEKWGMTSSMIAARLISGTMDGDREENTAFSPPRFQVQSSVVPLIEEGMHAVRDLSRRVLIPPREDIERIEPGKGGIVDYDGHKTGVYKNEEGEIFFVSIKCPHMGCQLEWNPDEKSWDCPCHGSRFDYKGKLLDNPAQEGLEHE